MGCSDNPGAFYEEHERDNGGNQAKPCLKRVRACQQRDESDSTE